MLRGVRSAFHPNSTSNRYATFPDILGLFPFSLPFSSHILIIYHRADRMPPPPSTVDSDDSLIDPSTAATTPAPSLTFSPVLHPTKLHDLDNLTTPRIASLERARPAPAFKVKNICCVGAGYVGRCAPG